MASVARPLSIPLPNGARLHPDFPGSVRTYPRCCAGRLFSCLLSGRISSPLSCFLKVRMFFVTAGYHRYFSSSLLPKPAAGFSFVIAWMAMSSTQKGVLWWAGAPSPPSPLFRSGRRTSTRRRSSASGGRTSAGFFPTAYKRHAL